MSFGNTPFSPVLPPGHQHTRTHTRICVRSLAVFINVATGRGVRRGAGAIERGDMWEWNVDRADQEQDPPNKVNMSALYIVLQP